ncbi:hypothetical protein GW17_00015804 [Ensete ventricosum]|nr:hypothetical protein GW17_00015804 [Ensete ventricosum]
MVTWSLEKLKLAIPDTPVGNSPQDGMDHIASFKLSMKGFILKQQRMAQPSLGPDTYET